jgi:hypothetical protein
LSRAEREIIERVLIKYAGTFHNDQDNDFKSTNVVVHKIETGDATPIKKAHQKNKAYYDKKAKERKCEVNDKVYLFCPVRKPGRCHKFRCSGKDLSLLCRSCPI